MNERIKEIRKDAKLSQEEFGARLHIKKSSVSFLESGRNNPSEQTLALIVKEFNVNKRWLETGEGTKYAELPGDDLVRELRDILKDEDPLLVAQVAAIFAMPKEYRDVFAAKVRELYNQYK